MKPNTVTWTRSDTLPAFLVDLRIIMLAFTAAKNGIN